MTSSFDSVSVSLIKDYKAKVSPERLSIKSVYQAYASANKCAIVPAYESSPLVPFRMICHLKL